jgi:hypothetical protein
MVFCGRKFSDVGTNGHNWLCPAKEHHDFPMPVGLPSGLGLKLSGIWQMSMPDSLESNLDRSTQKSQS